MNSKSLLIAIAAFAVTATGAQAYMTPQKLGRAGFSEVQVEALTQARDLRQRGKYEAARDLLVEAGIDENALVKLKQVAKTIQSEVDRAVVANDFEAFKAAVAGTPLADIVTSESDFADFRAAHELRQQQGRMHSLPLFEAEKKRKHEPSQHVWWEELTEAEQAAFLVAKQANDRTTMHDILMAAGVERGKSRGHEHW